MVTICIRMLRIPFEWLELAFECFKSRSKGMNLDSNALSLVRMVRICIRMPKISFECFEFVFECFEFLLNGSNLHNFARSLFLAANCYKVSAYSLSSVANFGSFNFVAASGAAVTSQSPGLGRFLPDLF